MDTVLRFVVAAQVERLEHRRMYADAIVQLNPGIDGTKTSNGSKTSTDFN